MQPCGLCWTCSKSTSRCAESRWRTCPWSTYLRHRSGVTCGAADRLTKLSASWSLYLSPIAKSCVKSEQVEDGLEAQPTKSDTPKADAMNSRSVGHWPGGSGGWATALATPSWLPGRAPPLPHTCRDLLVQPRVERPRSREAHRHNGAARGGLRVWSRGAGNRIAATSPVPP
jgi:hypothetical protein